MDLTLHQFFRGRTITSMAVSQTVRGALTLMVVDEGTIVGYLAMSKEMVFKIKAKKG
jgi:hypothetical protein